MKHSIIFVLTLLGFTSFAQQSGTVSKGSLGIGLHLACPQNEHKDIKYDDGYGLNLSYLSRQFPANSKLNYQLGIQLDFANMKHKDFKEIELEDPNIIGNATITASNNMYGTFAVGRINYGTREDKITPYANLVIGHRNYSTRQHLSLDQPGKNLDYQSDTITHRVVHTNRFHYGAGVGVNYRVNNSLSLELGATYTFGQKGATLPLSNIIRIDGTSDVDYRNYKTVNTDMLLINVGIRIHLFKRYFHHPNNNSTTSPSQTPSNTRYKDTRTPRRGDPPIINDRKGPTKTPTIPKKKTPIKVKPGGGVKDKNDKS